MTTIFLFSSVDSSGKAINSTLYIELNETKKKIFHTKGLTNANERLEFSSRALRLKNNGNQETSLLGGGCA